MCFISIMCCATSSSITLEKILFMLSNTPGALPFSQTPSQSCFGNFVLSRQLKAHIVVLHACHARSTVVFLDAVSINEKEKPVIKYNYFN